MSLLHKERVGTEPKEGGRDPRSPSGPRPGMKEKPGFPSAGLPGKTGPDRSAGVKRIKQHPKSIGL